MLQNYRFLNPWYLLHLHLFFLKILFICWYVFKNCGYKFVISCKIPFVLKNIRGFSCFVLYIKRGNIGNIYSLVYLLARTYRLPIANNSLGITCVIQHTCYQCMLFIYSCTASHSVHLCPFTVSSELFTIQYLFTRAVNSFSVIRCPLPN